MSDPAIEARAKAIARIGDGLAGVSLGYAAECGAREMAKSVQELIAEARTWKHYPTREIGSAYLADTVDEFLDELSKRVYPSEELNK